MPEGLRNGIGTPGRYTGTVSEGFCDPILFRSDSDLVPHRFCCQVDNIGMGPEWYRNILHKIGSKSDDRIKTGTGTDPVSFRLESGTLADTLCSGSESDPLTSSHAIKLRNRNGTISTPGPRIRSGTATKETSMIATEQDLYRRCVYYWAWIDAEQTPKVPPTYQATIMVENPPLSSSIPLLNSSIPLLNCRLQWQVYTSLSLTRVSCDQMLQLASYLQQPFELCTHHLTCNLRQQLNLHGQRQNYNMLALPQLHIPSPSELPRCAPCKPGPIHPPTQHPPACEVPMGPVPELMLPASYSHSPRNCHHQLC